MNKFYMTKFTKIVLILIGIGMSYPIYLLWNNEEVTTKPMLVGQSPDYVGSNSCKSCHAEIYESYVNAAHFQTSSLVDKGHFENVYKIPDSIVFKRDLYIKIHKDSGNFYQTAVSKGVNAVTRPFDMTIGSGRKGQTFLFWNDSSLYQLPLSYSVTYKGWINSPGYPADKVIFNRLVPNNCFQCHATSANAIINTDQKETYDQDKMVLSISCESCHGPGAKHNDIHSKNSNEKVGAYIINTKNLKRQQKLDACASCHSGLRKNIKPAFSFVPGEKIDDYFEPAYKTGNEETLDVHGNQYGLLTASKCFKNSAEMNCSTCHNVHQNERESATFVQKCLSCHSESKNTFCTVKNVGKTTLINKCIDCHMPKMASNQILFKTNNDSPRYDSVRTHFIKIYKEDIKTVDINNLKKFMKTI